MAKRNQINFVIPPRLAVLLDSAVNANPNLGNVSDILRGCVEQIVNDTFGLEQQKLIIQKEIEKRRAAGIATGDLETVPKAQIEPPEEKQAAKRKRK